jgi:hypothetical protein
LEGFYLFSGESGEFQHFPPLGSRFTHGKGESEIRQKCGKDGEFCGGGFGGVEVLAGFAWGR